jgi:hypothetical protein
MSVNRNVTVPFGSGVVASISQPSATMLAGRRSTPSASVASCLQSVAAELGQLVDQEDAMVGEAYLSRAGDAAATDQAGVTDGAAATGPFFASAPRRL